MLYLSIILVIISCVIVLIIFWNEVEKENETELEMEKNNKIVKTGEVLTEKQVSKSKRNKKE